MSTAATQRTLNPEPRTLGWLSVAEASRRTGLSERQWQRKAAELTKRGLAVRVASGASPDVPSASASAPFPDPRSPFPAGAYRISPDADPRLKDVDGVDNRDLTQWHAAPEPYRARAQRRAELVRKWREHCGRNPRTPERQVAKRIVTEAKEQGMRCSVRSLQEWSRRYYTARPGGGIMGVYGLLDRYGSSSRDTGTKGHRDEGADASALCPSASGRTPEAIAYLYKLYRTQQRLHVTTCHDLTAAKARESGWLWPASVRSTQAWLAEHDNLAVTYLARHGYAAYMHRYGDHVEADYSQVAPADEYVADSHLCKLIVSYHGRLIRPWLIANMDRRTRCVVGWSISPSGNQDVILAALRDSYVHWAVPVTQKIDNGRDYASRLFTGESKAERRDKGTKGRRDEGVASGAPPDVPQGALCPSVPSSLSPSADREATRPLCDRPEWRGLLPELGIAVRFALPFNPQSKHVERFFRTFTDDFVRTFASFVDTDPVRKPEANKLIVAEAKDLACDASAVPTLDAFRDQARAWFGKYHRKSHQGDGMGLASPLAAWEAHDGTLRKAPAESLHLLLQIRGKYRVGKNGVGVRVAGTTVRYGRDLATLPAFKGRDVLVAVDEHDIDRAMIFTTDRQLIGVAAKNQRVSPCGASAEEYRDAIRNRRRAIGDQKRAIRSGATAMKTAEQLVREQQAKALREHRDDGPPPTPNASMKPVQTGFDLVQNQVERELEQCRLRKAAGAEHDEFGGDITDTFRGNVADDADFNDAPLTLSFPESRDDATDDEPISFVDSGDDDDATGFDLVMEVSADDD